MIRKTLLTIILFTLGAVTLAPAAEIAGIYQLNQDGELLGVEKFSVDFKKDGSIKTDSTGTIHQDKTSAESLTELHYRKSGEIKDYQREVYINKVPHKLIAVNQGPHLTVQMASGATQSEKKLYIHPQTIVLDVGTYHHYHVLLKRYKDRGKGKQEFWAAIPAENREIKINMEFLEHGSVETPKGWFEGDKYFVNQGDVGIVLWVDARNKIFRIEIPMQGFVIDWKNYKGKRATQAAKGKAILLKVRREEVTFKAKDGTPMSGSITKPVQMQGPLPAIVFASTSGPQDRDGLNTIANIATLTGTILDRLSEEGYLVLRYDDRGIGKSGGDFAQNALSMQEGEIDGALEYLINRKDVDSKRLAVIGHGEGANVAMRVAGRRTDIKAAVFFAPSSISMTQLAVRQIKTRLADEGIEDPEAYKKQPIYRIIQMSRDSDKKFQVFGGRALYFDIYREWDNLDPISDIKNVKIPMLHLQGGNDQQIFPDLADTLNNAEKTSPYTFKRFEGLDHFFVKSDGSPGSYAHPGRKVDDDFLKYLVQWLGANL